MERLKIYLRCKCKSDVTGKQDTLLGFHQDGIDCCPRGVCAALTTKAVIHVICVPSCLVQGFDRTGNVVRQRIDGVAASITGDLYEVFIRSCMSPRRRDRTLDDRDNG